MRPAAPLRAHARRDPLTEFKIEAFHLFELMLAQLRRNVTAATMRVGFGEEAAAQTSDEEQELGSRLIKSTIQVRRRDRQRPGSFAPVCRSGLRCA